VNVSIGVQVDPTRYDVLCTPPGPHSRSMTVSTMSFDALVADQA
jgi:hypothetical protein